MNNTELNILIVDDQKIIRDSIKLFLEKIDIQINSDEAVDGESAIKLATQNTYDIILMDISMPKINGIDAAKTIKKINPKIKIIMISMHTYSVDVDKILNIGVNGYIIKENIPSELEQSIQDVLENKVFLSKEVYKFQKK